MCLLNREPRQQHRRHTVEDRGRLDWSDFMDIPVIRKGGRTDPPRGRNAPQGAPLPPRALSAFTSGNVSSTSRHANFLPNPRT